MRNTEYGVNWDSKNKKYVGLKKLSTKEKAENANILKNAGMSVKDISMILGKSKSRIYEYLTIAKLEQMVDDYINSDINR